ncbi:helix-turn-helix domain-containing protein [Paenibacillus sp. UMB4589-SE434]|uniref:helix-turn-helix domain-containing protein n=1 Tax=Paenibacillus sp. UMB4589-SE434 TaxID=3046314 RepID=UPI00254AAFE5|nr:helix-turn-helix domain-containing protein [Paenibacillus sp. UMB4589-SE434]MDK8182725.1 helix-turn-helix domain-containing protein [Paenibacillus sp. UMB4589-SE434]
MKWNHFKSKLLLKYIISYLSICLIPLVILTVFIYQNAVNNLRSEIEQTNVNQLTQAKKSIDDRMKELQNIATRIAFDEQLSSYQVHHPYFSRDAISALDKYKVTSAIIDELFLYFRGDKVIYSSQGLTDLDVFTKSYMFHNWTKEVFVQDLNNMNVPTMRPAELVNRNSVQESKLAYLVPITPNSPYPHGTIMYWINESMLTDLIESILDNFQGNSYIFDTNGQVLAANNHGTLNSKQDIKLLSALGPGIHSMMLNHEQHSVVSIKSEVNGWTYVTSMPSAQFFSRIFHIQTIIVYVFCIVVLAGTVIAIMLARRQYHPIFNLMQFAKLNTESVSEITSPTSNELEWIQKTLHDYSSRVDIQEPYARNQFLFMMLKHGNSSSLNPDLMDKLGIHLDRSHHFVIHMGWDGTPGLQDDLHERQVIMELLTEVEIPEYEAHAYGIELPQPDQLALLISFTTELAIPVNTRMEQIVEALRISVMESSNLIPAIGVGTCYTTLEQLNQSYIEASSAFECRMVNGKGSVTFFDKLSYTQDHAFWIPKDVLLKLAQSLKQGSHDVAIHMVGNALANVKTEKLTVPLLRCICFDILNTMLKTASEMGINDVVQDLPNVTSFDSLEELEQKLLRLAAQICSQVEQKTVKEERSLMDQIVAYIDEHYTDYTLSLETISVKYAISSSYFSRSFKEKVGTNFSQYIWQRRMEEVIRQLLTTTDSLKDIINRVGYLDTPNFIRKFKKETGHTPGQYRKLFASDEIASTVEDC